MWILIRDAITYASMLILLSTGLTLTYITTKVPNFAHGEIAVIGLFVAFTFLKIFGLNPYLAMPVAFVLGALAALVLYKLILRPLMKRGATLDHLMIATLGYDILIFAMLNIYADFLTETYKVKTRGFMPFRAYDFTFLGQPGVFIVAVAAVAILMVSLHLLLTRTRFGIAMRATIENPHLASVCGVNVELVYTVSWILAGGLASMAGVLLPFYFRGSPCLGFYLIVPVFTASIVGGFYSIYGAMLGGAIAGLSEYLMTYAVASAVGSWFLSYRIAIPLIMLALTLLLAPEGLTGVNWRKVLRTLKLRLSGLWAQLGTLGMRR